MAIQDIVAKILAQAEAEAKKIAEQAQAESQKQIQQIHEKGEEARADIESETDAKIERAIAKAKALAKMEGKNQVLKAKQELVSRVLEAVVKKLSSIPAKEYEQLLSKMLVSLDIQEGTLYPAKGKESSTKGAIKLSKKSFTVGESRDIAGGFIIESETADADYSFENIVMKSYKQELESTIIEML